MLKYPSYLRHGLLFYEYRKPSLYYLLNQSVCRFLTINSVSDVCLKQIRHLLRAPAWNFRYLPSGMCDLKIKRHYIQGGNYSQRGWSKMAVCVPPPVESELKEDFDKAFPLIINSLVEQKHENDEVKDTILWLKQVMEYNVQGGKKTRGLALVVTFNSLYEDMTNPRLLDKAYILGWCIEMLQAFFLVSDDIMDQSQTRRGRECWYKKVGLGAVNDGIMLESVIYKILKDHFAATPCYGKIIEEFRETTWRTTLGQCMDMKSSPDGHPNWDLFTLERYESIVKYKTTWYTFCLPIRLAVIMGEWQCSGYQAVEDILIKMGYYFQVQDDYLDCFGDPCVTGKHGSDIEDGKCTWLVLEALKAADDDTKKTLKDNYGMNTSGNSSAVKELYKDLCIPEKYAKFEVETHKEISEMIHRLDDVYMKFWPILFSILDKLHQRVK